MRTTDPKTPRTPAPSKNQAVLEDFVAYCESHPHERFWQALRNWSGQPFILACDDIEGGKTRDTFYWEGKGAERGFQCK